MADGGNEVKIKLTADAKKALTELEKLAQKMEDVGDRSKKASKEISKTTDAKGNTRYKVHGKFASAERYNQALARANMLRSSALGYHYVYGRAAQNYIRNRNSRPEAHPGQRDTYGRAPIRPYRRPVSGALDAIRARQAAVREYRERRRESWENLLANRGAAFATRFNNRSGGRQNYTDWWENALRERSRQRITNALADRGAAAAMRFNNRGGGRQSYVNWWENALRERDLTIGQRISKAFRSIPERANNFDASMKRVGATFKPFGLGIKKLAQTTSAVAYGIRSIIPTQFLTIMSAGALIGGVAKVVKVSDAITSAQNRSSAASATILGDEAFNADGTFSKATEQLSRRMMEGAYQTAVGSRSSFSDMMGNVGKSLFLGSDAFNKDYRLALHFQDVLTKAYRVSGATETETSASMGQIMQALSSGLLQGDELRSMREGATYAYRAVEKFAQELYGTTDSLKELGSQGKITSKILIAGVLSADEQIDRLFANTKITFSDVGTQLSNTALKEFMPIQSQLSSFINSNSGKEFVGNLQETIKNVMGGGSEYFKQFTDYLKQANGDWDGFIENIVSKAKIVGGIIGGVLLSPLVTAAIKVVEFFGGVVKKIWDGFLWLLNGGAGKIVEFFVKIVDKVKWLASLITPTFLAVLAPIAAIFFDVFQIIKNILNGTITEFLIDAMDLETEVSNASARLDELAASGDNARQAVEDLGAAAGGTGGAVADLGGKVAKAGSQAGAAAEGFFRAAAGIWAMKAALAASASTGVNTGAGAASAQRTMNAAKGNAYKISSAGAAQYNYEQAQKQYINDIFNSAGGGGGYTGGGGGGGGGGNKLADTMELAEKDLKYLCELAEMEWKREFTTAEINIDMSGMNNNMNGEGDINGFIGKLTQTLRDELAIVAEGVYI